MDRVRVKVDILKYKITLFTTILGSGVFMLINKKSILDAVNITLFYAIIAFTYIWDCRICK